LAGGTSTATAVLYDDFTIDKVLNGAVWTVTGPAATAALRNFTSPPANVVIPTLSFSGRGMGMSGVNSGYTQEGVQSVASFAPPFSLTAKVSSAETNAASFQLAITTLDGGAGAAITGGYMASWAFRGLFYKTPSGPGSHWNDSRLFETNLDPGVTYNLAISVDSAGTATLSGGPNEGPSGQASLSVGHGPFYVVLSQGSGAQPNPGPNQAYWRSIRVSPPRESSAPLARHRGVVGTGTPSSCTEEALDTALSDGGNITFDCGPNPVTITVTSRKIIATDASLDGRSLFTISGGGTTGIFAVNAGIKFALANVTIRDGHGPGCGGAIRNDGILSITNGSFSGNFLSGSSCQEGGAIYNSSTGVLTVTNSTFSGNSGTGVRGGAICSYGTLAVIGSTFSGNSAITSAGGAIANSGRLTVTNSTFSGNTAGGFGGGAIANLEGVAIVTSCTFSGNSGNKNCFCQGGGAISNVNGSTLTLTNSIVANSPADSDCLTLSGATTIDGGHNIDDDGSCRFSGASFSKTNPLLDPAGLASNGGPTQTIALRVGSPAIGAGDLVACAAAPANNRDQRGFVRRGKGSVNCSIGAYEFNSPGPQ
jgi:predicted outer membrane repeat protein